MVVRPRSGSRISESVRKKIARANESQTLVFKPKRRSMRNQEIYTQSSMIFPTRRRAKTRCKMVGGDGTNAPGNCLLSRSLTREETSKE